nr:hypothetical protein [Providencia sp. PROV011]
MQNRNGKAANLADAVNISEGKKWAAAKVARKSPSDINQQRAGKDLSKFVIFLVLSKCTGGAQSNHASAC